VNTPKPPTDNFPRVFRGESWYYSTATVVRAAYRYVNSPSLRYYYFGFRCAQRGVRQPLKVQP
jgi:formylglycine-generating enzyme required for sulfatase activity